jgi:hypothetical protein
LLSLDVAGVYCPRRAFKIDQVHDGNTRPLKRRYTLTRNFGIGVDASNDNFGDTGLKQGIGAGSGASGV